MMKYPVKLIRNGVAIIFICLTFISQAVSSDAAQHKPPVADKLREQYESHLLWGERFLSLHFNSLALRQFEKAKKLRPAAIYPQYRINQLKNNVVPYGTNYPSDVVFDFNKPGTLIWALIIVIVFSIFSMIVALVAVLFNRNKMNKIEKRKQFLREEYQTLLIDFLFSQEMTEVFLSNMKKIASSSFSRTILINQMIDLSITLSGNQKERLKELYLALNLQKESYKKAMSRRWHIKAKGFRELAFMNIPIANTEIIRCLSSRNDILRMEAQFAMIRLFPDNALLFLDHFEKNFTLWEQLNVYETITFHNLNLPDFEHLLKSDNNSVVMFALRMIKVFKLDETFNAMVGLLTHDDPLIRNLTIEVMGHLKMNEALPYLKRIYKSETPENCIAIIQAMATINDAGMLNFLKLVLDKEDDVQLQIEAAKAISKIGDKGSETLSNLLQSDYKNYQIIVKHVLDKRIN